METTALVDMGCTSLIKASIVPSEYYKLADEFSLGIQMDGTTHIYTHYIDNCKISFIDTCNSYSEYHNLPKAWIRGSEYKYGFRSRIKFYVRPIRRNNTRSR